MTDRNQLARQAAKFRAQLERDQNMQDLVAAVRGLSDVECLTFVQGVLGALSVTVPREIFRAAVAGGTAAVQGLRELQASGKGAGK